MCRNELGEFYRWWIFVGVRSLQRMLRCTGMCECPERQDAERDRPRHLCFLHIASLPQPTALTLSRYAWVLVDVFLFFNIQPYTNLTL